MAASSFTDSEASLVPYTVSSFEFRRRIRDKRWNTNVSFEHGGTEEEKKELVGALFSYALDQSGREFPSIELHPWKDLRFKISDELSVNFETESFEVFVPLLNDDEVISIPLKKIDRLLMLQIADRTRLKWTRELWDMRKTLIQTCGLGGGPN